jgi:hypothetical protein
MYKTLNWKQRIKSLNRRYFANIINHTFLLRMKKYFFSLILIITGTIGYSQKDSTLAPFKRFPTFPPVKLLLPDSSSYFTKEDLKKKSATMLMIFNPDCEHCQHETEAIIKHIDEFKHIQIIMATMMPFNDMLTFREKYNLTQYDNIIVGRDIHFFLPGFYMISNLPFLAFYNKKKELISVFEGSMPIEKALEELKK